jgi:PHD/YefM family antitoxin component YafN of YafNO toxin-antitoxin module
MNNLTNLTTSTEIQRNYKAVSKRARASDEALIVMLNNKPDLVVMNYDLYKQSYQKDAKTIGFSSANDDLMSLVGTMTHKEVVKLNRDIDDMNEKIYSEDWK